MTPSHLVDLRNRLVRAFLAIIAVTVCLLPFASRLYDFLAFPMAQGVADPSRSVMSGRTLVFRRKGSKVDWDGKRFSQLKTPVLIVFGSSMVIQRLGALGLPFDDKGKGVDANFSKLLAGRADIAG